MTSPNIIVPDHEPRELRAGDTWVWNRQFANFRPADGWVLTYYLRGASAVTFAATSTDGVTFNIVVPAATTAAVIAGAYQAEAKVSLVATGEVYAVWENDLQIRPNFQTATAGQLQPNAEIMLAAIEGEIAARLGLAATGSPGGPSSTATSPGSALEHYTIAGREITKIALKELYTLRAKYRAEVSMLEHGGTLPPIAFAMGPGRRSPSRLNGDEGWL